LPRAQLVSNSVTGWKKAINPLNNATPAVFAIGR
jgi:hypothetical protein